MKPISSPVTVMATPTKIDSSELVRQIVKKTKSENVSDKPTVTVTPPEDTEEEVNSLVNVVIISQEEEEEEDFTTWGVSIFGKGNIGELKLPFGATLKDARIAMSQDSKYPK